MICVHSRYRDFLNHYGTEPQRSTKNFLCSSVSLWLRGLKLLSFHQHLSPYILIPVFHWRQARELFECSAEGFAVAIA